MATTVPDTNALLRQLPLFRDLTAEDVEPLARSAQRRTARRGEILFLEGEPGDVAYIVLTGLIDLVLESAQGDRLLLHRVNPGDCFGEMALLDAKPRSATAVVVAPAEMVTLSRQQLLEHLHVQPTTALRLLQSMSERLRIADEKIKILKFLDVAGRLARCLLDQDRPPGQRSVITLSQDELASMIGSTRQTVSRVLSEWRQAAYVATDRGQVIVVDRAALERFSVM